MSRIQACFARLKELQKTALIPYITAGDPNPEVTVPLMHAMVDAGANLLELGVPFSDPMADGPVIQAAAERALEHHVSLHNVLDMVRTFRQKDADTAVVLMGYLNPVEVMGYDSFAQQAADAGVDGLLTVDIPPEESKELNEALASNGLDPIYLIAPTSTSERIQMICDDARGFVYYVSVKGVTGSANLQVQSVADKIDEIRTHTGLPIGVGFGIGTPEQAANVAEHADAVVVGSAIVNRVCAHDGDTAAIINDVCELLSSMRKAMDEK